MGNKGKGQTGKIMVGVPFCRNINMAHILQVSKVSKLCFLIAGGLCNARFIKLGKRHNELISLGQGAAREILNFLKNCRLIKLVLRESSLEF